MSEKVKFTYVICRNIPPNIPDAERAYMCVLMNYYKEYKQSLLEPTET